jgi:hypothetical protein
VLATCACGRRPALPADGGASVDSDTGGPDLSAGDSGVLDAGLLDALDVVDVPGGGDDGVADAGASDANWEAFSPCPLIPSGEPVFVDFAPGALWRGLVVLDRGDPRASPLRSVHVGLHALVDRPSDAEIHAADVQVPAAWPTALSLDHPEEVVGPAAHSAGVAGVTHDGRTLILTYYGHPNGSPSALQLLPIDVATWTAGPFTTVASGVWAVSRGMANGSGLEPRSAFAGEGFGIVWSVYSPDLDGDQLQAAVLHTNGTVSSGPWLLHPGAPQMLSASSAVTWTGTTYLFAAVSQPCPADDPSCPVGSVMIARAPTNTDDANVSLVTSLPLEGTNPCCVAMAAYGGAVWVAWFERAGGYGSSAWNARLVRLDPDGAARESPVTIASAVPATGWLELTASRNGAVVVWMESSAEGILLQLRQFGPDGRAIGLPTTRNLGARVTSNEGLDVVPIDNPSGMLVGWSGSREGDAFLANTTALLRFECDGQSSLRQAP